MGRGLQPTPGLREPHGDARVPFSYIVDGYKLDRGSIRNASTTPMEHLTPTADADSRSFLAGLKLPAPTAHYVERHGNAADPRTYAVDGERFVGLPGGRNER